LATAQSCLRECLERWPLDADAHFLLARTCRRQDDIAGCLRHLDDASVLQWPRQEIDFEYSLWRAQTGDLRTTEPGLRSRLASYTPDEELILEALCKGCLETHLLADVRQWSERWMEHFPQAYLPYLYRGRSFEIGRSLDRAATDYEQVLKQKSDQPQALLSLAGVCMLQEKFAAALQHYETYFTRSPDDVAALLGAANCALSLGRPENARAYLDRLFARQKEHPGGLLLEAKLELDANRPAAALEFLKRAEAVAPHETDITYALLQAHQRLGHAVEVKEIEKRLEELRQRFKRLEELRKQIARDPDNVPLRFEAGNVCLALGHDDEAIRWFHSVLQLDPEHAPTHRLLADYFHRLGDEQRAELHRRQATR
ncbi:MAG TPA: tetratricopeptide repeat protein, partial [Gemmataceae bacterium]|nr:tetratricopeptide repeat protein [Gemmataceae bacterium]